MRFVLACLAWIGVLIGCCALSGAQDAAPAPLVSAPRFEVAAIRRNVDSSPGLIGGTPGGRMTVRNVPVRFMIRFAYNVQDFQISGGPSWMNTDTYDVDAKASENVSFPAMRPLLQKLLDDRFQLVVHHETKEMPAYELRPGKSELKIGPSKDGSCGIPDPKNPPKPGEPIPHACGSIGTRPNLIEAYSVPMNRFIATLSGVLGRPVLDKTGITYNVDIHLEFVPDEFNAGFPRAPGEPAPASQAPDVSRPSIFAAIQEQLGLKLEGTRAPGDILVVDRLERPSEN